VGVTPIEANTPAFQTPYIATIASILNTTTNEIRITEIVETTRRRLTTEAAGTFLIHIYTYIYLYIVPRVSHPQPCLAMHPESHMYTYMNMYIYICIEIQSLLYVFELFFSAIVIAILIIMSGNKQILITVSL
jgi:hypothetical protein